MSKEKCEGWNAEETACAAQMFTPTVPSPHIEKTPTPIVLPADIEKEEQAVYSSFFTNYSEPIVILQETSTGFLPSSDNELQQRMEYITSGLPDVSKETLNDFLERNRRQPSQLSPDMQLGVEYVLLSAEEFSAIMNQSNGWDAFYEKYSRLGYMQFSRVGFNKTLDQAVLYVGSIPGPMMGGGNYYLMEKMDGQWVIKEQVLAWVS
jgi:hypothetical protein